MSDIFDELETTEPEPDVDHPQRVKIHQNGLTIDLDLHELLNAIDPQGKYVGYDPEADEAHYEPSSFAIAVADLTAQHLTKMMRKQIKDSIEDAVHEAVMSEVTAIVKDALENGELQRTGEFGRKEGEPRPLKEIIVATAADALTKPLGDSYSRTGRQTVVQKIITDAVGSSFTKELRDEVSKAKRAALDAVSAEAAGVIKETIEKMARGGLS